MTNVSVQADTTEKEMIEALSYDILDCSQSAGLKHAAEKLYRENAGNIHPRAIRDGAVDVAALLRGEIDPEDVDEKYRMDGDGPAQVPVSDGGVAAPARPSSYTPTHTPQDLATAGTELTYDELTDAIGQHWSDDLEIHPDRVRASEDVDVIAGEYDHDEYALRASQTSVAKILTGILRSKGAKVPAEVVEDTILTYTAHQINRADTDAGRRYKVETYTKVLVEKLGLIVPHPDPLEDVYYTSEAAAKNLFRDEVVETVQELVDEAWLLDPTEHAQREKINPKEDAAQWVADLAAFRQKLGFLHAVRESDRWAEWLADLDNDLFDEFPRPQIAVGKTFTEMLNQYLRVNQWARFAAANAVLQVDDESLLETTIFDEQDNEVEVNADQPTQPMTKWVTQRKTPLSPQGQIDRVSEKL